MLISLCIVSIYLIGVIRSNIGLKSQIAGYWTFEVAREAVRPDLNTADSICTHELPNK